MPYLFAGTETVVLSLRFAARIALRFGYGLNFPMVMIDHDLAKPGGLSGRHARLHDLSVGTIELDSLEKVETGEC